MKENKILKIMALIIVFVLIYLINNGFIYMGHHINYIFLMAYLLVTLNTINKLLNSNYASFNRIYLKVINIIRLLADVFDTTRISYYELDSRINEGNRYIVDSSKLFISINIGFALLITLIWQLVFNGNPIVLNSVMLPLLIITITILLVLIPILAPLVKIHKKVREIESKQDKKIEIKTEEIITIIAFIALIIFNIIICKKVKLYDLICVDLGAIALISLSYGLIRTICMKIRRRKNKNIVNF